MIREEMFNALNTEYEMTDIDTLAEIKTHLEKRQKVVISWNATPIPDGAADWKYGISQQIECIPDETKKNYTFKIWEIINRETLDEIPAQVKDTIEFDDTAIDKLEFPVFFYIY